MDNDKIVADYGHGLADFLRDNKVNYVQVYAQSKVFTILFDSKESRKIGLDFLKNNKPTDDCEYVRLTNI